MQGVVSVAADTVVTACEEHVIQHGLFLMVMIKSLDGCL